MTDFNIDTCTLQEACDYAIKMLVSQGGQCMYNDLCAYGDDHGNHCAVGWLLPADNEDLMAFQGTVGELITKHREDVPAIVADNPEVMRVLQNLHDNSESERRDEYHGILRTLQNLGIDTGGAHWQQWYDITFKEPNNA